ncbi:MAG TPA: TIR domain-containing protein [Thermoanaerobaculia bacterium]|jgi:hypothetical protein|nr:TIR domain-containing protein [Thermoanaerobaculia bacterium]
MARRVFFSFHHQGDILRIGQIRNSWVTKPNQEDAGFVDAADWESIKRQGDLAVKRWIEAQLNGTSVTVVLIGAETASRPWVLYEISESHRKGNGLLGIYIHNCRGLDGSTCHQGVNPFTKVSLASVYPVYDWVNDNGYNNMGAWIETAARNAGR